MTNETGGIVLTSAAGSLSGHVQFPKEFHSGLFGRFDRQFSLILLICTAVVFTAFAILAMRKPSMVVSEKEITQIQERYARLVLNKPEVKVEQKKTEVKEAVVEKKVEVKKEEEKKEEIKIDREKETFAEKTVRKASGIQDRRQIREQNARQIQSAGLFAALTSTGSGSVSSSSTADLLGAAGIGVSDLGSLSLSKGTFATRNVDPAEIIATKGERTTSVDISRETLTKTTVATVASNVEVNVTSRPPEITGESASLEQRSQSAIQSIVSRESRRLKRLYEEWLKRDPTLSGRLEVKFVILASGVVSNVSILKSTTNNSEFDDMVVRYIKRWQFPAVEGSGPVEVVYPFVFEGQS